MNNKGKFARKTVKKKRQKLLPKLRDKLSEISISRPETNAWFIRQRKWLVAIVTFLAIHILWPREIKWWKRHRGIVDLNDSLQNHPFIGVCFNKTEIIPGTGAACDGRRHGIWDSALPWSAKIGAEAWSRQSLVRTAAGAAAGQQKAEDGPLVSVVMPFHNNGLLTCQSLHEIAIDSQQFRTEVILIDDASRPSSSQLVEMCARAFAALYHIQARVVKNEKSMGYSFSCNIGAQNATGELLLFANNDMFLSPGALGTMIQTLRDFPKAGAVGPLFLGDRNVIQEFGGVIYRDASAANAYRGSRKFESRLWMAHEADYISAACLLISSKLFHQLGGFDRAYGRGYYEDTDLCMAIRHAGLKVVIQPFAISYHQEGHTFGADSKQKRLLMDRNKQIFYSKWWKELQQHSHPKTPFLKTKMRYRDSPILWMDQVIPTPSHDSGSQRTWQIFSILRDRLGHQIDFFPVHRYIPSDFLRDVAIMRASGIRVLVGSPKSVLCLPDGCPYKAIFISRPNTADVFANDAFYCCPGVPVIYDTVDLHFLREAREIIQERRGGFVEPLDAMTWTLCANNSENMESCLQKITPASGSELQSLVRNVTSVHARLLSELRIASRAACTLILNNIEGEILRELGIHGSKLRMLSNIYSDEKIDSGMRMLEDPEYNHARKGGIFVGSFQHIPNILAVKNLINITEGIRTKHPDFRMHVVGSHDPPESLLQSLEQNEGIVFHGWLPDDELDKIYGQVECSFVPLSTGAGVKGKVAAAYLHAIPVIGSRIALEGMGLKSPESSLLAETVEEYMGAYDFLRSTPDRAQQMTLNGIFRIRETFSASQAARNLTQIMNFVYRKD